MDVPTNTTATVAYLETVQQALTIMSTLNLCAYLNYYDGCVQNNSIYDYIVIGGGNSGSPIARRLSDDKKVSVLVIEAGGNIDCRNYVPNEKLFSANPQSTWNYTVKSDENYKKCHRDSVYRPLVAKVLGGKSSIDDMISSEGSCRNYDSWARITNESSWSCSNVQRLLKKIYRFTDPIIQNSQDEDYHRSDGPMGLTRDRSPVNEKYFVAFSQAGKKNVRDINFGNPLGVSGATYSITKGKRLNAATQYLTPVRKRKNLTVLKNCMVTKLIFNNDKRVVAVNVACTDCNKTLVIRANREVIVAAGTTNTAKLLQLSGIGTEILLDFYKIPKISVLPVGLNFKCHVGTVVVGAIEETNCTLVKENNSPHNYPSPTVVSYASVNNSKPYSEYRTISFIVPITPGTILREYSSYYYRFSDQVVDSWYNGTIGRESMFTIIEPNYPRSHGQVRIVSLDPSVAPLIDPKFYANQSDVEDSVKYVKDFVQIYDSPLFKTLGASIVDPTGCDSFEGDDYWRCYVRCLMSPSRDCVGTAALGSVVDGRLRVKGVKCLRVADSSIMPDIIQGGTTLPEIMIGENCAEFVKQEGCGDYYKRNN